MCVICMYIMDCFQKHTQEMGNISQTDNLSDQGSRAGEILLEVDPVVAF